MIPLNFNMVLKCVLELMLIRTIQGRYSAPLRLTVSPSIAFLEKFRS